MKITNLEKQVGDFRLSIPFMELEAGRIHGLIGPNGSGKSTLAKVIMNIYEPDGGSIDYEGTSLKECTLITQRPYLLHKNVYENLVYPLKVRGIKPDEELVEQLLRRCGLEKKRRQYARSLSSGERQKLAFARAMIFSPKLILIDETFSNMDPDSVRLFEEMILEQQKLSPATWIIISHQLVHISKLCDQVHYMESGTLVESGNAKELLLNPTNEKICRFLAATEVSFQMGGQKDE